MLTTRTSGTPGKRLLSILLNKSRKRKVHAGQTCDTRSFKNQSKIASTGPGTDATAAGDGCSLE
jgi:hypothetical protein